MDGAFTVQRQLDGAGMQVVRTTNGKLKVRGEKGSLLFCDGCQERGHA